MMSPHIATPLRRRFLKGLAALASLVPARMLLAARSTKLEYSGSMPALSPFLDTLLPADSTPSASQLAVNEALLVRLRHQPRLARLVAFGCAWLDAEAVKRGSTGFSALSALEKEAIVSFADQAPQDSLPGRFFAVTRSLAFEQYYANPESWAGLGFAGPPQPAGFPDHSESPGVDRS